MKIRQVKTEIRILGLDDARFNRARDKWTRLVGVVHRGGKWIEGCLQTPIRVDGQDVTERLTRMILESNHYGQLRIIMTRDTIFAGTNVLDLPRLVEDTRLPVIAVSDSEPDMRQVKEAMQRYAPMAWERKMMCLDRSGPIRAVESRPGCVPIYLQWAGLPFKQAVKIVQMSATRSRIPEPIRVAHLFASSFIPDPEDRKPE